MGEQADPRAGGAQAESAPPKFGRWLRGRWKLLSVTSGLTLFHALGGLNRARGWLDENGLTSTASYAFQASIIFILLLALARQHHRLVQSGASAPVRIFSGYWTSLWAAWCVLYVLMAINAAAEAKTDKVERMLRIQSSLKKISEAHRAFDTDSKAYKSVHALVTELKPRFMRAIETATRFDAARRLAEAQAQRSSATGGATTPTIAKQDSADFHGLCPPSIIDTVRKFAASAPELENLAAPDADADGNVAQNQLRAGNEPRDLKSKCQIIVAEASTLRSELEQLGSEEQAEGTLWLLSDTFNNVSTLCFIACFYVMAAHKVVGWMPALIGGVPILILLSFSLVNFMLGEPIDPSRTAQFLGALAGGVGMSMLVGRIESKLINPPLTIMIALYVYACMQPLWYVFPQDQVVRDWATQAALMLKLVWFALVYWLIDADVISHYLRRRDERFGTGRDAVVMVPAEPLVAAQAPRGAVD